MRRLVLTFLFVLVVAGLLSADPVSCGPQLTVAQLKAFSAGGGCFDMDKLYTNFDTSLPGNTGVLINTFSPSSGIDYHQFQLVNISPGSYLVTYTISVIPPSLGLITSVQVAVDIAPGTASVAKTVTDGDFTGIVPTSFGPSTKLPLVPGHTTLNVSESITVNAGSQINSVTDTYVEEFPSSGVPETASAGLMVGGLALIGLGVLKRKKRAM